MQEKIHNILSAMSAENIPAGQKGIWTIRKVPFETIFSCYEWNKDDLFVRDHTFLSAMSIASMHTEHGETVMEDTTKELSTHLNFIIRAQGNVVVSGLGLGCVVRGLLTKSDIDSVTVIERDQDVIDMVMPYMPNDDRLNIIHECAIEYSRYRDPYDFGWHDIWSNPDLHEPHLSVSHLKIINNSVGSTERQGAWGIDRSILPTIKRRSVWYESGKIS